MNMLWPQLHKLWNDATRSSEMGKGRVVQPVSRFGFSLQTQTNGGRGYVQLRSPNPNFAPSYGLLNFKSLTVASVLCANRIPYTPSVDFSFPGTTSPDLSNVFTTEPLMRQETLSPFTCIAISCVTGCPVPAALCTASFASRRPFN